MMLNRIGAGQRVSCTSEIGRGAQLLQIEIEQHRCRGSLESTDAGTGSASTMWAAR